MPTNDNATPTTNAILCYHVTFTVPWSVNNISVRNKITFKERFSSLHFFKAPLTSYKSGIFHFTTTSIYQVLDTSILVHCYCEIVLLSFLKCLQISDFFRWYSTFKKCMYIFCSFYLCVWVFFAVIQGDNVYSIQNRKVGSVTNQIGLLTTKTSDFFVDLFYYL